MFSVKTSMIATTLAIASITSLNAFAQTAMPHADERQAAQQQRIANGAASGQLTPHETNRLEKQEASVSRTEARAKADGVVTPAERKRVRAKQAKVSRHINAQKHDAQVTH